MLLISAGAAVGVIAAAFAMLFMNIHKVLGKLVSSLGLHVSILPEHGFWWMHMVYAYAYAIFACVCILYMHDLHPVGFDMTYHVAVPGLMSKPWQMQSSNSGM